MKHLSASLTGLVLPVVRDAQVRHAVPLPVRYQHRKCAEAGLQRYRSAEGALRRAQYVIPVASLKGALRVCLIDIIAEHHCRPSFPGLESSGERGGPGISAVKAQSRPLQKRTGLRQKGSQSLRYAERPDQGCRRHPHPLDRRLLLRSGSQSDPRRMQAGRP